MSLKAKSGEYTNLAYLLSDQSEIVVKVAEYDSEMNFKIKKEIRRNLGNYIEHVSAKKSRGILLKK